MASTHDPQIHGTVTGSGRVLELTVETYLRRRRHQAAGPLSELVMSQTRSIYAALGANAWTLENDHGATCLVPCRVPYLHAFNASEVYGSAIRPEPSTAEGRLCSRSFASHPENHTEPVGERGLWGRCLTCGEVVNISGDTIPEHQVPTGECDKEAGR